jgi:Uma2 family endonuclease
MPDQREGFAPVVPEFLVEVRSPSDRLPALGTKMHEWIANGCRLAWLIDPINRSAAIYRADGTVTEAPFDETLNGEDVLPGFVFDPASLPAYR